MLAFFLGAFIFGLNAFAGKSVDWPGYAGGSSLAVIEGTIKSIDFERMKSVLKNANCWVMHH
jgi:hypothetical protein